MIVQFPYNDVKKSYYIPKELTEMELRREV